GAHDPQRVPRCSEHDQQRRLREHRLPARNLVVVRRADPIYSPAPAAGRRQDPVVAPMRTLRVIVAWFAIVGLGTSAFAGDLHESIAKAAAEQPPPPRRTGIPKGYLWTGTALFVGGMTVG